MLGYHVHEKAILLAIVPLTLDIGSSPQYARVFQRLTTIGHYSLLPLIFPQREYLLKVGPVFLMCVVSLRTEARIVCLLVLCD